VLQIAAVFCNPLPSASFIAEIYFTASIQCTSIDNDITADINQHNEQQPTLTLALHCQNISTSAQQHKNTSTHQHINTGTQETQETQEHRNTHPPTRQTPTDTHARTHTHTHTRARTHTRTHTHTHTHTIPSCFGRVGVVVVSFAANINNGREFRLLRQRKIRSYNHLTTHVTLQYIKTHMNKCTASFYSNDNNKHNGNGNGNANNSNGNDNNNNNKNQRT